MTQPNPCASWKRSLAIVWIGEFFSVLTSSILQMGLIWHVTLTTGSASACRSCSLAAFLPMALLGAFAGGVLQRGDLLHLVHPVVAHLAGAVVIARQIVVLVVPDEPQGGDGVPVFPPGGRPFPF